MNQTFLESLNDSSGNRFVFGKVEGEHISVFVDTTVVRPVSITYINLYKGHESRVINEAPVMRENVTPDWFFPVIILVLAIYAWIRVAYNKYLVQMIQAFINNNLANQIVRDENIFIQRASITLSLVYNIILALFIYLVSIRLNWTLGGMGNDFGRFVLFLILVSAAYAIKFLIIKVSGWLFEQEREMATYIFQIFLINNILGMILVPFVLIFAFHESIFFPGMIAVPAVFIFLSFGWRIFRGIQIGMASTTFSPLYLFLYLCTLEIVPFLVVMRIVVS